MARRPSLRARVALAAGLGAVVVAVVVAGVLVVLLARREVTTLDRRLTTVTDVLSVRLGDDEAHRHADHGRGGATAGARAWPAAWS